MSSIYGFSENFKLKQERVRKLKEILETPLTIPFDEAHKKIEELMQRPVWTHEMAFPQLLYDEILSGKKGYAFKESINEIQHRMGKPCLFIESKRRRFLNEK